ncbi:hypothetical protein BU24DRAFT_495488 [Aaosphaeria arxii CBS 175.79]|uniref:Uncharacterized protein n=1 Tax=Aaosphaeria arxii CBS 175.79 TaxID=1450172 RepID=A0A6A5XE16_9PLEO|nr:uncharacterized protein BU24DRAFT_495488 [Aaosphaeria arxii CBS 175.79]KAF2011272.1 hypothetical protein BU24DRAFT_495488 [Aaosphaeria arxii CBS 175.79]
MSEQDYYSESLERRVVNKPGETRWTKEITAEHFLTLLETILRTHPETVPAIRNSINGPWQGNLSNPIHCIFRRQNWPGMAKYDILWNRLQPALKLATRYITSDKLQGFWIRTLLGHQVPLKNTSKMVMVGPRLSDTNPGAIRSVANKFEKIADNIRWEFGVMKSHGSTQFERGEEEEEEKKKKKKKNAKHHHLRINVNYFRFLLRGDSNEVQRIQTNWMLASTFVHELAHAFFTAKTGKKLKEPLFDIDHWDTDLGWAWERWMWGPGRFNGSPCPTTGIQEFTWRPEINYPLNPSIRRQGFMTYEVHVRWLHEHFLEETWNRLDALPVAKRTLWDAPKVGVAVLQGPSIRNLNQRGWYWVPDGCDEINRETVRFTPARGTAL